MLRSAHQKLTHRSTLALMRMGSRLILLAALLAVTGIEAHASADGDLDSTVGRPTNVILFIPDGCGPASYSLAREYLRYAGETKGLSFDHWLVGTVSTYSSSSRVTDSGAAATAYASGVKTYNTAIGVDSLRRAVVTLVEAAEEAGLLTGLIATSRITHATPAAFSAHVPDREMEDEIAAQQIGKGIEVIFGGGRRHFQPSRVGGARDDGRDLLEDARALGYRTVLSRDDFDATSTTPVLGLFTSDHMAYEIDRDPLVEPSLAEMTQKAIDLLSTGERGFFLMVEGGRIDHAGHGNDAAAHLHDILAFDDAVSVALNFAERHGRTLVVGVSDHETGGLSLGTGRGGEYNWHPAVLAGVEASKDAMIGAIRDEGRDAEEVLSLVAGISKLREGERRRLEAALHTRDWDRVGEEMGRIISERALIGWTTDKHTAVDVPLFAFGPGQQLFAGHHDNSEIGVLIARLLSLPLPRRLASH